MKEHPIIFNIEMAKALLEGRKTQTRRPMKFQDIEKVINNAGNFYVDTIFDDKRYELKCPYEIGDRLWVRETWRVESFWEGEPMWFGYKAGGEAEEGECDLGDVSESAYDDWCERMSIQSSEEAEAKGTPKDEYGYYHWDKGQSPCRWRPSIHMPRWASRINLEITDIRAERVQDITEEDAKAEGVINEGHGWYKNYVLGKRSEWFHYWENVTKPDGWQGRHGEFLATRFARTSFATLWDLIYKKRDYRWNKNPWVWVIELKVID